MLTGMKRNLSALFLCLLMIASSLAGCMGTDDSTDDSAVTELENEITMQDEKIAELEAEVATLTTQHQDAVAELATVQSTLQTTQTSLDAAEANATMHQAQISSLETERNTAQAEIDMLYELMSNMSDQSNETFESMALQIAELNQHMSNLSSMLNESYDRHQENATLVSQLTAERDNLQVALEQANNTIAGYLQDLADAAADAEALAELQDHVHGIIGATALDPETNGDPKVSIVNNGLSTQFTYTSNISEEHTIYIEFCNFSIYGLWNEYFEAATGEVFNPTPYNVDNFAYRVLYLDETGFTHYGCIVLQTDVSYNQFNTTLEYPNLNLFDNGFSTYADVELVISVCKQYDCPLNDAYAIPNYAPGELRDHYFAGGDVVPVTINGEIPCTLGFTTSAGSSCLPPACTEVMEDVSSGTYVLDCETVVIEEHYKENANYTLLNATTFFFYQSYEGTSEIYVCDASASAYFDTDYGGTVDVYVLGLGASNERHISWTSGSSNEGYFTTNSGGHFAWGDPLGYGSDISFLDWNDPDGVC